MNLYLITRDEPHNYDTWDMAVVAAADEQDARTIHPGNPGLYEDWDGDWPMDGWGWVHPKEVKVRMLGVAAPGVERGRIMGSFNAG